ncbi:MAG: hypothetical protein RBS80_17525 [Thermoguttaceae bacterium]|jgi:hypothetical protein|nr:hypothetical protein [Thermoguttaceae bacterium]
MMNLSRRELLKLGAAGLAASAVPGFSLADEKTPKDGFLEPPPCPPFDFKYPELGAVKPVASKDIEASPLGVGFETLDRMMFEPDRAYKHVGRLGVKWARCQTGWARTEKTPGEYDFAWLDDVAESLLSEGVKPWFSISYGNRLVSPDAPDWSAVGWAPVFSEEAKAAWLRYTRAISKRYADRITHWEIWNEPNIRTFWQPNEPSPGDYTELVRITAEEIRRNVPGAVIIGGALAGMPTSYLQQCLEAGLGGLVDKISYHPYRPVPEQNYETTVAEWWKLLAEHNPKLKLWQGENGAPSIGGPRSAGALSQLPWSEVYQAKWLLRRILLDLLVDCDMTSYFTMVDLAAYNWGRGPSDRTNYKGLLRAEDYTPKPSYFAYQCLCALFDAKTKKLSDQAPTVKDTTLAPERVQYIRGGCFGRGGTAMHVAWFPSKLPEVIEVHSATVDLPVATDAAIADPVLIDPLSAKVFQLDGVVRGENRLTVKGLPLLDYPLIVTDRRVALG